MGARRKTEKRGKKKATRQDNRPGKSRRKAASSKSELTSVAVSRGSRATKTRRRCPVVAVGASAGGLESLQAFLGALPANAGLAVVVIVHLDPNQTSTLADVLQAATPIPVVRVDRRRVVRADHVYVIPPGKHLTIDGDHLDPIPREGANPIDSFCRALARARGSTAACAVLSGTGSDGTLGLRAVKGEGGVTLAQDESAIFGEMPGNAVLTGLVDFVLPPAEMPGRIGDYFRRARELTSTSRRGATAEPQEPERNRSLALQTIFAALHAQTGRDFSQYKASTISRRIERRMAVHLFDSLEEYVAHLKRDQAEIDALFRELLIGVTSFFRDPPAFEALREAIIEMLARKAEDEPIRVWVPGCSTGEEAYSVAMLVDECLHAAGRHPQVRVFGTDIDEEAIEFARKGLYPSSIRTDLTAQRLKRYFTRDEVGRYQVGNAIREMLIFAVQDVTKDPPFSRLDLLACRNLLIYLSADIQGQLLSVFHYSLKPNGLLFLGSSESVGTSELFQVCDRKAKLFKCRPVPSSRNTFLELSRLTESAVLKRPLPVDLAAQSDRQSKMLFRAILQQSDIPPCVVVDQSMNVVYVHGRTGRFLETPEGGANVNLLDMARPGLKTSLASCVRKVTRSRKETEQAGITLRSDGEDVSLDLVVKPIVDPRSLPGMSVVYFHVHESKPAERSKDTRLDRARYESEVVIELRQQLVDTQENLQSTIEELETANEELKSTNEELQSTNEELQSSNEELQTSKEELQSVNEESATVNAELSSRIDELARTNDDLKNLLDSTGIATIFLDSGFNVRRFTPGVNDLIPLTATDVGRPLSHFSTSLLSVDLVGMARAVLDDLVIREQEVTTDGGRALLLRIRPYRTTQNVIDGTVLTFEDRTELRRAQDMLEARLTRNMKELSRAIDQLQRSEADRDEGKRKQKTRRPRQEESE